MRVFPFSVSFINDNDNNNENNGNNNDADLQIRQVSGDM